MKSQKVIVENARGEKLVGTLDDTGSVELCILCHGLRSHKDFSGLTVISAALNEIGVSTYRFDFSGNGESDGEFIYGGYWHEVEDLRAVVLHWRAQGRNVNRLFGHSKGGDIVLLYTSKYGDVPTVVNASARFVFEGGLESRLGQDFKERMERDGFVYLKEKNADHKTGCYKVTKESLMERLSLDMRAAAGQIPSSCRVLTVHGSADEAVPVQDAHEFDKLIANHSLKIVQGADHCYTHHLPELKSAVMDFLATPA